MTESDQKGMAHRMKYETHFKRVLCVENLHVEVVEEQVMKVDRKLLHQYMPVNFGNLQLEYFSFRALRCYVVDQISTGDLFKLHLFDGGFGELIRTSDWHTTPFEIFVIKTQHNTLLLEIVFGNAF